MKALGEAASGVAQSKKGEPLDMAIDQEAVTAVDLEEGEVLKLPPTPEMTDGHECESDSETERVVRQSRPPLLPPRHAHTQSTPPRLPPRHPARAIDTGRASLDLIDVDGSLSEPPSPSVVKRELFDSATPPIPPRSKNRPVSVEVFSVDDKDLPPAYDPDAQAVDMSALGLNDTLAVPRPISPASSYADESPAIRHFDPLAKTPDMPAESPALHIPPVSTPGVDFDITAAPVPPEGEMSETERREWEQHLADKEEKSLC